MFAELKRTKQKSHMLRPKECGKHGKYFVIVISLPNPFQNKCQSNENKKRLHVFAQKKKHLFCLHSGIRATQVFFP